MSHDIFISYSHEDTEAMVQVRDFLRRNDLEVWTDEGIEPGTDSWKQAIEDALLSTNALLVLFSPGSANSKWVRSELDFAELHKVRIFSLLVHGDEVDAIPFGYATHQWIDFRQSNQRQSALERLLATVQRKPMPLSTPELKKEVSKPKLNWRYFVPIAFVIVLILTVALFLVPIIFPNTQPTDVHTPDDITTTEGESTETPPGLHETENVSVSLPSNWILFPEPSEEIFINSVGDWFTDQTLADQFLNIFTQRNWDYEIQTSSGRVYMGIVTNQGIPSLSTFMIRSLFVINHELVEQTNIPTEQEEKLVIQLDIRENLGEDFVTRGQGHFFFRDDAEVHTAALFFIYKYEDHEEAESIIAEVLDSFQFLAD